MQTILVKCLEKIVFPLHSKYTLHKRSAAQLPKILIRNLTKGGTCPQPESFVHCSNQESRREGWTDAAIMLCKLNKSL